MNLEEWIQSVEQRIQEQERRLLEMRARIQELEHRMEALEAEMSRYKQRVALMEKILVEKGLLSPDFSAYEHWLNIVH